MTHWIAERDVVWITVSGERKAGRIAIGLPEAVDDQYRCVYVVEPFKPPAGVLRSYDTLGALYLALMMVGHELYSMFARGVRAVYPQDDDSDPEDPDADTASLIMALGPLIREVCNPRGVADPDGKLAKLEAIIEEQMPAREGRTATQARAVLTVLQARDVAVPDAFRERILAMTDVEQLERWLRRAAVATSIRDVLDDRG